MSDLFDVFRSKPPTDEEACSGCGCTSIDENICLSCGTVSEGPIFESQRLTVKSAPSPRSLHMQSVLKKFPTIPSCVLEMVSTMFASAQYELRNNQPKKNSLFYDYVLYKLLELTAPSYCKLVQLKRTPQKLQSYDMLWKDVCKAMRWEYIPT